MPEDPPWWEFADTSFEDMAMVCEEIVSLHGLPRPIYISVNKGETAASVDAKLAASKLEASKRNLSAVVATGGSMSPATLSPTAKSAQSSGQAALQPSEARARAGASSPSGSVQGASQDDVGSGAPFQRTRCDSGRADSAAERHHDVHHHDETSDRRERELASDRRDKEDGYRHRHGRKGHRDTPKSSRPSRRKGHHDSHDNGRMPRDGPRDRSDSSRGVERMSKDRLSEIPGSRKVDEPGRGRGHGDNDRGRRSGQGGRRREVEHRSSPLRRRSPMSGSNGQSGTATRVHSAAFGGVRTSSAAGAVSKLEESLPGPPSKPARTLLNWDEMAAKKGLDTSKASKRRPDPGILSSQGEKLHCPVERIMPAERGEDIQ